MEIAVDSFAPFEEQKRRALSIIDTSTQLVERFPMGDDISADAAQTTVD